MGNSAAQTYKQVQINREPFIFIGVLDLFQEVTSEKEEQNVMPNDV